MNDCSIKQKITYSEYGKLMDQLTKMIQSSDKEFNAIHGLPRGGLPISVHLSHYLQLPLVANINHFLSEYSKDSLLLVVDDIVDTGRTFDRFFEIAELKNLKFETATLCYKPHTDYIPTYSLFETNNWIIFPWEPVEEIPNREEYEHLGGEIESCSFNLDLIIENDD